MRSEQRETIKQRGIKKRIGKDSTSLNVCIAGGQITAKMAIVIISVAAAMTQEPAHTPQLSSPINPASAAETVTPLWPSSANND